jgi:hypothetical protein
VFVFRIRPDPSSLPSATKSLSPSTEYGTTVTIEKRCRLRGLSHFLWGRLTPARPDFRFRPGESAVKQYLPDQQRQPQEATIALDYCTAIAWVDRGAT